MIVWSATDVPSGDEFEDMNDLFIKCRLGSGGEQSTDTHLRLPAGQKGSFNWRMKFPLHLPVLEDIEGGARLTVEVRIANLIQYLLFILLYLISCCYAYLSIVYVLYFMFITYY